MNGDAGGDGLNGPLAEAAPLEEQIAAVTAERDDYLDQLQRTMAEFANFRRRVEQERTQAREFATRMLLAQIVPVMDDFQRALSAMPAGDAQSPWVAGVQLIERKLQTLLEKEGVSAIDALGQPFDPALHEAVATAEGSSGQYVVEVYQQGYRHGQGLLRPAMVKVGDKPETSS